MRVSLIRHFFVITAVFSAFGAFAGVTENFNSRKGISINEIRMSLQNLCWTFHHFDVNNNGWNPRIEGDGAMVSDINALQYGNAGIYTPLLTVQSSIDVSFEYVFNEDFDSATSRWLKVCLANASNEIVQELETLDFIGVNAVKTKKYSNTFKNINPGEYRLVLQYGGKRGSATIAVDELTTSAQFKYAGGCNNAPVALRDNITGMADRPASGSLIENDNDKNNESLNAYLIKGSRDGKVELTEDGRFTFTPNKNFKGNITSFTYKICDEANLCSPDATVYINFPAGNFVAFTGSYNFDGNVQLAWNTEPGSNIEKFVLERNIDNKGWKSAGIIPAKTTSHGSYTFNDGVGRNKVLKNDIYYRLKQIKSDGSMAASKLLIVRVYNTRTVSMISVTPNPAKSDIAVSAQLHDNCVVAMRIINTAGNTVLHRIANAVKGNNNIIVEGSGKLKPGLYTLEVIVNSKERMLVKLIKE